MKIISSIIIQLLISHNLAIAGTSKLSPGVQINSDSFRNIVLDVCALEAKGKAQIPASEQGQGTDTARVLLGDDMSMMLEGTSSFISGHCPQAEEMFNIVQHMVDFASKNKIGYGMCETKAIYAAFILRQVYNINAWVVRKRFIPIGLHVWVETPSYLIDIYPIGQGLTVPNNIVVIEKGVNSPKEDRLMFSNNYYNSSAPNFIAPILDYKSTNEADRRDLMLKTILGNRYSSFDDFMNSWHKSFKLKIQKKGQSGDPCQTLILQSV